MPVALGVPFAVVELFEAVEVERDEREVAPVAAGPRRFLREPGVEGAMVEQARKRISAGALGKLARDVVEVGQEAVVERTPRGGFAAPLEHPPEEDELCDDLSRREPEALSVAGELLDQRPWVVGSKRGEKRRQRAELAETTETGKRRRDTLAQRLVHALDGDVPRRALNHPGHARRLGAESARMASPQLPDPVDQDGWRCRARARFHLSPPALPTEPRRIILPVVTMRELLEAGVHFGHQTRRWNPKMRRFIFTERGGIYIIDLQQTLQLLEEAHAFLRNISERGGTVLFVGTKKQCQDGIAEEAERTGMPYVNHRWLGGLLTNWRTISERLERMKELRRLRDEGQLELLPPKERIAMMGELEKLETNLGGVAGMDRVPDAVFVIDLRKEQLAVREARRLGLPVIALVDTNCDPDDADYVIPGNDDAIRSCNLVIRVVANAIAAGRRAVTAEEMTAQTNGQPEEEAEASAEEALVQEEVPAE